MAGREPESTPEGSLSLSTGLDNGSSSNAGGTDDHQQHDATPHTDDTAWWAAVAESCVRVTFAGFAGALIGHAKEQQQKQQHTIRPIRRAPPRAFQKPRTNLPTTWSVGCMTFVMILETCRRVSPTSWAIDYTQRNYLPDLPGSAAEQDDTELYLAMVQSLGDLGVGGMVAGMAGAVAQRRRQTPALPTRSLSLLSLTGTGLGLGLLAGLMQGGVDVISLLLERMEQKANSEGGR